MQFVERLPHKDSDLLRIRHDVVVGNIIFFSVVERGSLLGSIHFCCCGDGGGAAADDEDDDAQTSCLIEVGFIMCWRRASTIVEGGLRLLLHVACSMLHVRS